jgi:predicted permease
MSKLWNRVYFLLHRKRMEKELAEEMESHRAMLPDDQRSQFGNTSMLRDESRDAWTWTWLEQALQDLSYGARVLLRAPSFTLGAVAVLALGVGVNLAEFQLFDALFFQRFAFRNADSVLQFTHVSQKAPQLGFPSGAVEAYRAESRSFDWLVSEDTSVDVVIDGDTGVRSDLVSANYFASMGIVPAWGRLLDSQDAQPGAAPVAVLGYGYWQSHMGADPDVVGRIVHVNNKPVQVVGVAPYTFDGLSPRRTGAWFPVAIRPLLMKGSLPVEQDFSGSREMLFGKPKPGVPQAAVEAELTALTHELNARHPGAFSDGERIQGRLVVGSWVSTLRQNPAIFIFIAMILLVLLSACANLGNMLLARGLARQREIEIRLSIGASRARIVRQLMTENFLLATLGTAAGVGFGIVSVRLLLMAISAPPNFRISMSWPMVLLGFVLTFVSAAAFGFPSALQTVRPKRRKIRLRQSLVGVQVAVSCLLLIASSVLAHQGIASASIPLAFDYKNMVVIYPQLYGRNLAPAVAGQKLRDIASRLGTLPGVEGVAESVSPPLGGRMMIDTQSGFRVYWNGVSTSYFQVMNLPVVRGRAFLAGEPNSAIVSESAARAVWPNQDPVGKVWDLAGAKRTVVGVVKDSGANLLADPDSVEAYVPVEGALAEQSALILHVSGDAGPLVRMIPGAVASAGEAVSVTLMRASRDNFIEGQKRMVTLIGSIGAVATTLAAAGMFALVAFAVAQRKRELGIRIAIGARPRHVLKEVLLQHARPTAFGAVGGVVLAVIFLQMVRSMTVMRSPGTLDVPGFAAGLACLLLVAVLATLSPTMRALRIDPSTTLREE